MHELEGLARRTFADLTPAELRVIRAAPAGDLAWCGFGNDPKNHWDPDNDPAMAGQWGNERRVRAELIRWLCKDSQATGHVHASGLAIGVVSIVGRLNLGYSRLSFPIRLSRCSIPDGIELYFAETGALNFLGSWIGPISARRLKVRGNLLLGAGSRVRGEVNLFDAEITGDLDLAGGRFINPEKTAIRASAVKVGRSVRLGASERANRHMDYFIARGEVDLDSAQIGADLNCVGGVFFNPSGRVLSVEGGRVDGSLLLRNGFNACGEVNLVSARIGGDLHCEGARLHNPGRTALNGDGLRVGARVFLRGSFRADGVVKLRGAEAGGELNCTGGNFISPARVALDAEGIKIQGIVYMNESFRAEGEVRLRGAQIGGGLDCRRGRFSIADRGVFGKEKAADSGDACLNLEDAQIHGTLTCAGARFLNAGKVALLANGAKVDGHTFLNSGFIAVGAVDLTGIEIGNYLECTGGLFFNFGGIALSASGAKIGGNVFLSTDDNRQRFCAKGGVQFTRAQIRGFLNAKGGCFYHADGLALNLQKAKIEGGIALTGNFEARGQVDLSHSEIGSLDCIGTLGSEALAASSGDLVALCADASVIRGNATFGNPTLGLELSLKGLVTFRSAQVAGFLHFEPTFVGDPSGLLASNLKLEGTLRYKPRWEKPPPWGGHPNRLELARASIGALSDDGESWPVKGNLDLDGLVYGSIEDDRASAEARLQWLRNQGPRYRPQPYRQLAHVLEQAGRETDSRTVRIASEEARHDALIREAQGARNSVLRFRKCLLKGTIGYGYEPYKALFSIGLFCLLGIGLFGAGYCDGLIAPTDAQAYLCWKKSGKPPPQYQPFNCIAYSLETFVPLLDLQQNKNWAPTPQLGDKWLQAPFYFGPGSLLRIYLWIHILAGWILSTTFGVALSGLIRRE